MISSIKLKNFKCFEKQEISLGSLTLLTGVNGSGKSTVIQSLLALRQSYLSQSILTTGLDLNGDLVSLGKGSDVLYEDAQEESISISLVDDQKTEFVWDFDYHIDSDVLKFRGAIPANEPAYAQPFFGSHFQYIAAERIGPRVTYGTSDFRVSQTRKVGVRGEYAAHLLAKFGDEIEVAEKLRHPKAVSNSLRHQVEAWLSEVTPGTRVHPTLHRTMDLVNIAYSFAHGSSATKPLRATNVGFGITYTLPVLLAVLATEPGELLIIENPEAHLHPRGQSRLGELLALAAESGIQLLVETHSDHLLNGIRLAARNKAIDPDRIKIHFFDCDRSKNSKTTNLITPKLDADGRLDTWPAGFFDEWDKNLEALLSPPK